MLDTWLWSPVIWNCPIKSESPFFVTTVWCNFQIFSLKTMILRGAFPATTEKADAKDDRQCNHKKNGILLKPIDFKELKNGVCLALQSFYSWGITALLAMVNGREVFSTHCFRILLCRIPWLWFLDKAFHHSKAALFLSKDFVLIYIAFQERCSNIWLTAARIYGCLDISYFPKFQALFWHRCQLCLGRNGSDDA